MIHVRVTYDAAIRRPNTALWIPSAQTLRCRIQVGSAPEVSPVDVHLRISKPPAPYLVHVRRLDESTFLTESFERAPELPRLSILLISVPGDVAASIAAI